jgi:hypothetical protein
VSFHQHLIDEQTVIGERQQVGRRGFRFRRGTSSGRGKYRRIRQGQPFLPLGHGRMLIRKKRSVQELSRRLSIAPLRKASQGTPRAHPGIGEEITADIAADPVQILP